MADPRIALVHDRWLTLRGGERIFLGLTRLFPQADCYALVGSGALLPPDFGSLRLHYSMLRLVPFSRRYYRAFLPLYPLAARLLDLRQYDLVISSSSGFCHAVRTAGRHLCYCHSPNRYAWNEFEATVAAQPSKLRRAALRRTLSYVRRADYQAAQRVTHYVANSTAVQRRIAQYYQRASTVVHPFIDVERYRPRAWPPAEGGPGFLVVSELLPYKRVDLAVAACARLGQPLVVVGVGPELERLKRLAGPTVRFAGRVSEEELARLYAECWALLQCGEEDFGMSALEAQAAGRPVIAYGAGGALETIRDEVTGRLFHEQSVDVLTEALRGFDAAEFDPVAIRRHAEQFDEGRFRAGITRAVEDMLSQPEPRPAAVGASRAARAWPAGDETLPGAG